MSNLISVPRELLERALTILALSPSGLYGELRALLAKPAAQPQGEPVEDCETFEYQLDMLGPIDRCNVSCGSYGDKYHQWNDAGPYVEYEDHVKHVELYKQEVERLSKLYTEQPAPVAVVLPDVCTLSNIIRKVDGNHSLGAGALAEAIIDEVTRLNTK